MREPKWSSGVYAGTPRVTSSGDVYEGHAHIECWRGTPDEFLAVLRALVPESCSDRVLVEIEWTDGTKSRSRGMAAFEAELRAVPTTRGISTRFDLRRMSGEAWLLARQAIPGLSIRVRGSDQEAVAVATQAAFARAMIGYVDRLGGWRAPGVAVWTVGVPGVAMLLLPKPQSTWAQIAGTALLVGWLVLSLSVVWPRMLAARAFGLVRTIERANTLQVAREIASRSRRRARAWVLGSVTGVILVGLLVNGLYDAILAGLEALRDRFR